MINYKKTILLTGAGFSKNFGGYLSKELWSKIFNNPDLKQYPEIKERLRSNFDFESVYAEVLDDDKILLDTKNNLQRIITKAYVDMDKMLGQYMFNGQDPYQINFYGVKDFLKAFVGTNNEPGIHFTLNQDLFMEKKLHRTALGLGTNKYSHYLQSVSSGTIDSSLRVDLPSKEFIGEFKEKYLTSVGDLFYIKLHGSLGWYSATGAKQMVLGNNKLADILKEPILDWYFKIFEDAICREGVKLFVVGYGFNDQHINKIFLKGIKDYGLKLCVISPSNPEDFKYNLTTKPFPNRPALRQANKKGAKIWNAVSNFFPYHFKEIFPADQSITDKKEDLLRAIAES